MSGSIRLQVQYRPHCPTSSWKLWQSPLRKLTASMVRVRDLRSGFPRCESCITHCCALKVVANAF